MESLYGTVAGLDVHKKSVVVVVLQSARPEDEYASGVFGTTLFGRTELVAFLREHDVRAEKRVELSLLMPSFSGPMPLR